MASDVQAPNSGWEEIDPDEKINLLAPESNGTSAVKEVINSPEVCIRLPCSEHCPSKCQAC